MRSRFDADRFVERLAASQEVMSFEVVEDLYDFSGNNAQFLIQLGVVGQYEVNQFLFKKKGQRFVRIGENTYEAGSLVSGSGESAVWNITSDEIEDLVYRNLVKIVG